jgi:hypothetical protein
VPEGRAETGLAGCGNALQAHEKAGEKYISCLCHDAKILASFTQEVICLEVIKALLSFLSYVFHGLLCLILIAMSGLAMAAGAQTLQLGMLPWTGSTLIYALFFGALLGLLTVILAIKGWMRPLFFVWSLVVTVLLVKGYIFSGYHFIPGEFRRAMYLIGGSVIALFGSWAQMGRKAGARR